MQPDLIQLQLLHDFCAITCALVNASLFAKSSACISPQGLSSISD